LLRQLEMMNAVRAGMAEKKGYEQICQRIQGELRALDVGRQQIIDENWRRLGRTFPKSGAKE